MKRRGFLQLVMLSSAAVVLPQALAACAGDKAPTTGPAGTNPNDANELAFDPKGFTEKTTTIGDIEVAYREWSGLVYVSRAVDADYQCLNIKQPTKIDGREVDPSGLPIVLAINIGGYLSSAPNTQGGPGGPVEATGTPPIENPSGPPGGSAPAGGRRVDNGDWALAHGMTLVIPGARGRDLQSADGSYLGKAPAAIVDLKAAVRYLKANKDLLAGNTDRIVSTGTSAGGALSLLLGASGDSDLYAQQLRELGAADTSDAIFAAAGYCPITDLEYADAAYAWCFRESTAAAKDLAARFAKRMNDLNLTATDGTKLTAENLAEHILRTHLHPAAQRYLDGLPQQQRTAYVAEHPWAAKAFTWEEFLAHVGRSKTIPAFDTPGLSSPENVLFGSASENARHFTEYGQGGILPDEVAQAVRRMNPMGFLAESHERRAQHWFLRVGARDTDTSFSVVSNLDSLLRRIGDSVDTAYYWDAGHGANEDPEAFIAWVQSLA